MMTEAIWVAIITGAFGLLAAIATGIAAGLVRVVNLVLSQSKEAVSNITSERDYWRREALRCRGETPPEDVPG